MSGNITGGNNKRKKKSIKLSCANLIGNLKIQKNNTLSPQQNHITMKLFFL